MVSGLVFVLITWIGILSDSVLGVWVDLVGGGIFVVMMDGFGVGLVMLGSCLVIVCSLF